MSGRSIITIMGKRLAFPGIGPLSTLTFKVGIGTVMTPVDVSFSLLICYNELKVYRKSTYLPSWSYLVLIYLWHVLWLCHSFKNFALLPSFLFHSYWITEKPCGSRPTSQVKGMVLPRLSLPQTLATSLDEEWSQTMHMSDLLAIKSGFPTTPIGSIIH